MELSAGPSLHNSTVAKALVAALAVLCTLGHVAATGPLHALVHLHDACQENSTGVDAMPLAVNQDCDDHLGHKPVCKVLMGFCRPARGYGKL